MQREGSSPWRGLLGAWAAALLYCLALPLVGAGAAHAQSSNRITGIEVRGNQRTEAEQVLLVITSTKGQPIDRETIAKDVKKLFGLGLYEDIRVEAEQSEDGYRLIFIIKERPAVASVEVEGEDEIKEKEILEAIDISENSVFTEQKLEDARRRVLKLYEEEGYFIADVEVKREFDSSRNQVSLRFVISENAEVQVRRVEFVGNEVYSDEELRNVTGILTKERNWLSWIGSDGKYREELFKQDMLVWTFFYHDHGYLEVEFGDPIIELSRDRKELFITVPVTEGPQFTIGEVNVRGDLLWPAEEILEPVETKPGTIFSRSKIIADADKIANRYADESYAFANVTPIPRTYEKDGQHLVDLDVVIDKGNKFKVGRIIIVGNVKTRDNVIRREMRLAEGEDYNRTKLEKSKQRITRLGFFEAVNYSPERIPGSYDHVNIKIEVTERPTGSINVGAGFSSLDQFFAQAQISQANLFGRGHRMELQAQVGGRLQSFSFSFTNPRVMDSYWALGFSVFALRRQDVNFDREQHGGSVSIGYELSELWEPLEDVSAGLALGVTRIRIRDQSFAALSTPPGTINPDTLTTSLTLSISHDTRNDRIEPTRGMYHAASVEFAENLFDLSRDTNDFLRYSLKGNYYYELPLNFVLVGKWNYGLLDRRERSDPLVQERFFGGGPNNLRGFNARSVGPYQNNSGQLFLLGGDKEFYSAVELLISTPWTDKVNLRPVVFFDAGDVYGDNEHLFSSILLDAGVGLRWRSPLGPIRFEFGWPLNNNYEHTGRTSVNGPVFQFLIGQLN
ncbi:MAG: outer membrane protein assembly factor BamA [Chrysiogenetes bacterium]|nr:outer membrane protein assembly factor BamA [Chrysiogenetes bacterium]